MTGINLRGLIDFQNGFGSDNRNLSRQYLRAVAMWTENSLFAFAGEGRRSFAFVVLITTNEKLAKMDLDDPASMYSFAHIDHVFPESSMRCGFNAIRKLRATLRTDKSTVYMGPDCFENVVAGNEEFDEAVPWGEYPSSGGRIRFTSDGTVIAVAVDGFAEADNHFFAGLLTDFLEYRGVTPEG